MEGSSNVEKVNLHELTSRFRSKKELYNFLSLDCKAFLPKIDATNVYFLKDIITGKKEVKALTFKSTLVSKER